MTGKSAWQPNVREGSLDALRGVAVLPVVIAHACNVLIRAEGHGGTVDSALLGALDTFDAGRYGVLLFFLISGFVIPYSLNPEDERRRGLRSFAVRRFFRLFPPYWLSILISVPVMVFFYQGRGWEALDGSVLAANVTMFQHLLGQPDIVPVYWTLAVELAFYLSCALLFALGWLHRGHGVAVATWICIAVPQLGLPPELTSRLVFLPWLFLGFLIRKGLRDRPSGLEKITLIAAIAYLVLIAPEPGRNPIAPAAALATFAVGTTVAKVQWPLLRWLGRISYGVYLYHPAVMYLLAGYLSVHAMNQPSILPALVLIVLATCLLAWLSHEWFEQPAIRLGARIARGHLAAAHPAHATPVLWPGPLMLLLILCAAGLVAAASQWGRHGSRYVPVDRALDEGMLVLGQGWSTPTPVGVWSAPAPGNLWVQNGISEIMLRVSDQRCAMFRLRGYYDPTQTAVKVAVGGSAPELLKLPVQWLSLAIHDPHSKYMRIRFYRRSLQSPPGWTAAPDGRNFAFRLTAIESCLDG